jgi:hypothetical protein
MTVQGQFKETAFAPEGPTPLLREIPPGAPFPTEVLGPLRAAVEAVQGATQAPVAIPAVSALAVASLAVQGFADVETLGGPRPTSLFVLTVARSGERKSSCDAPLLAALRAFEKEQAKAQRDAFTGWQNAHALWAGERNRILAEARKSKGEKRTAAQADLESLGPEPAMPPSPDRTVTEPTTEGLTRLFATGQPSLGVFSDEAAQFLGGHAMNADNRQKTLVGLNGVWQCGEIRRTRAGDRAVTLYGRRLAVHLMVQPVVAQGFMADPLAEGTGFSARFLLSEPPSTIGTRRHAKARHNPASLAAFGRRLREILEPPMQADEETRALQPRLLPLSARARELLIRFAHAVEVTPGDMANGFTLAQFYLSEAARLASAATVSAEIDRAEALRRWLPESWPEPDVLVRDVVRLGPNALRESPKAHAALRLLEAQEWLVPLEAGTVMRGAARAGARAIVRGRAAWFDARAALAEIEGHPPATSATLATQAPRRAPRVAGVASVATPPTPASAPSLEAEGLPFAACPAAVSGCSGSLPVCPSRGRAGLAQPATRPGRHACAVPVERAP